MGKSTSKARVTLAGLMDKWPDIIAPEDPLKIMPERVSWRTETKNAEGKTLSASGTLHILAPSAFAAKLMYQEAVIIERVNRMFGLPVTYQIKRLSITHHQGQSVQRRPKVQGQGGDKALDEETARKLSDIEDPVIRATLTALARAMANKQPK